DVGDADDARGIAEARHQPARTKAIERLLERRLANAIIDDIDTLAAGDFLDPLGEIFLAIVDDMVAAMGASKLDLFFTACRADHGGAECFGPLCRDETNATCSRLPENGFALGQRPGLEQEVIGSQPFEHDGGGSLVV